MVTKDARLIANVLLFFLLFFVAINSPFVPWVDWYIDVLFFMQGPV
jgi:hypothetical protein